MAIICFGKKTTLTFCLLALCVLADSCASSRQRPEAGGAAPAGSGQSSVTVALDPANPGAAIPSDYLGLSFETEKILADTNGGHYFSRTNKALIATFKTLGIKNLRIGGNTSDRATVKLPVEADVDSLFSFAKAAGARVIYTLRLKEGDPAAAARMAKYIQDHYPSELLCFAIGNEPSSFGRQYSYSIYRDDWKRFMEAIVAAAPGAKFCGANVHQKPEWARQFAADFGPSGRVVLITEHFYPGGSAYTRAGDPDAALTDEGAFSRNNSVPRDAAKGRALMLSGEWRKSYQKLYDGFVPAISSNGLPYRLEEVNNFFHGGLRGASDSLASALWALDYSYWWAAHECSGVNFHTGDIVAAGGRNVPCRYAAFLAVPGGYEVEPIGYGLKLFGLGSRGRLVPVTLGNSNQLNLTAYGVLNADKDLYVTLINNENGAAARDATVTIVPGGSSARSRVIRLAAPGKDLSATSGVTLGDAEIRHDGRWNGTWRPLGRRSRDGSVVVQVPAGTAAVVRLEAD